MSENEEQAKALPESEAPKKKRGRPRKEPVAVEKEALPLFDTKDDKPAAAKKEVAEVAKSDAPAKSSTNDSSEKKVEAKPASVEEAPKEKVAKEAAPVNKTEAPAAENNEGSSGDNSAQTHNRDDQNGGESNHHNRNRKRKKKGGHPNQHNHNHQEIAKDDPRKNDPTLNISHLQGMSMLELSNLALECDIDGVGALTKHELVCEIIKIRGKQQGVVFAGGVLEILSDGFGFLRSPEYNYQPSPEDVYLSQSQIKRFSLRSGDIVFGETRSPRAKERFFAMTKVDAVNGDNPFNNRKKIPFENLTPDFPDRRIVMETDPKNIDMRVLDLVTPLGFGQRGLIVAPPRTGKTVIMQQIANSISTNHPDAELIVLLIDERPEEVTDMKRMVKGEVVSSTFDEPQARHVHVAEMVIEKAKRMVEQKKDVIILLDSITRLARAYNVVQPHSGKILSGGVDANALHKPKRFFGAARNVQEGGSLTILATALVDTGSKMDEVIFEEFKGTGNAEVLLDRSLIDKRIFPAINIEKSGTRKEELLLHPDEKERMWKLRRAMMGAPIHESMQLLLAGVKKSSSNAEFLMTMKV